MIRVLTDDILLSIQALIRAIGVVVICLGALLVTVKHVESKVWPGFSRVKMPGLILCLVMSPTHDTGLIIISKAYIRVKLFLRPV